MTSPEPLKKPRLFLRSGNGVAILSAASRAAGKGGWLHSEWLIFSRKARRLEWEQMFALVCSHFDVQCASSFSKDPANWRAEDTPPEELELTPET